MKEFLVQYSAMRFALDRQDRRRRGQHGVVVSLLLAFGNLMLSVLLLPTALFQLLITITRDARGAPTDARPTSG